MHIHFERPLDDDDFAVLHRHISEDISLSSGVMDPAALSGQHIDYLVAGRPSADLLDSHKELKALVIPWVGPPRATVELISARPHIPMYNIHHNAVPVAEMALGLLLAAARNIPLRDSQLRKGMWQASYHLPTTILKGKTVLLLGYGAISAELHPVLQALGMKVQAVRRGKPHMDFIHSREDLDDLMPRCDVLVNTLPLTGETRGMIGKAQFARMKSDTIVVNVGRGRVIDEEALFNALKDRQIQSAGLDVWYHYPRREEENNDTLPARLPFWELENVVLSPHIGGEHPNPEVQQMRMEHVSRLLAELMAGYGPPPLDPTRGY